VSAARSLPAWARLFQVARALIRQVNANQTIIDHWTLGGGTAMMLQIDHRESRDVDIFLSDPQCLSFLDLQKNDFQFAIQPDAYRGDGARSLRIAFDGIGEIDFIVAAPMTSEPTTQVDVDGEPVLLETVPEVITKKVWHRANYLKPRDIFDIAAGGERHEDLLIRELQRYRDRVAQALVTLERVNSDFVNRTIAQLSIKERYRVIAKHALDRSKELLRAV
jgi:Nucleotidyl transferase AbiEii toxin, Type IV TA system